MKYLLLLALVMGLAHGREGEVSLQDLTSEIFIPTIEKVLPDGYVRNAKMIAKDVKNIAKAVQAKEHPVETTYETMRTVNEVLTVKALVESIVQPLATLATGILVFVNDIMAIVGLVFLIIYLIGGGDVKALLGTGRSLSTEWELARLGASIMESPAMDTISEMVNQAIRKYD